MNAQPKALFPGTFDPCTLGHVDIAERAARIFGTVIIAVSESSGPGTLLPVDVRVQLIAEATAHIAGATTVPFKGLTARYGAELGATVIVRGLRHGSDLNYEAPMAIANRAQEGGLETIFLLARADHTRISSSLVRDLYLHGGNIDPFVTEAVAAYLQSLKFPNTEQPA